MEFLARTCPICTCTEGHVLFQQTFATLSSGSLMAGYPVTICNFCGNGYADKIPPQATFDKYYADMSKYTSTHRLGEISPTDKARFSEVVDLLEPYVTKGQAIADVGCATGGLLAEFKRRGYTNLFGFDPSPPCVETITRLHGIPAKRMPIVELAQENRRFDLVIMTCVLEHLRDVKGSIELIASILNPGGKLYIEVPDATDYARWYSAPYQFFSMEHINFFSPKSLSYAMAVQGLKNVFTKQLVRYMSPRAVEPAIGGLFEQTTEPLQIGKDTDTEPALLRYLEASAREEKRIHGLIEPFVQSKAPLAVWGAGTHTLRLLETSNLAQANITTFIDSNPSYQGKKLIDIPIVAPSAFASQGETVLISSHMAQMEIVSQIHEKLGWTNPLLLLYLTDSLMWTDAKAEV